MHTQRQSGISLIIVAVLLVAIGSAVGVMVMRKESAAVWDPKTGSQTDIIAIKDALISFQRTHHRLPCVAQRNILTGAAGYGEELANCAGGAAATGGTVRLNIGGGNFLRIGAVPIKTLGMSTTAGEDEWKNRLLYAVIEKLTDPYQFTNGVGAITINDDAGAPKLTDAAFVVLSHGSDGKGAYGAKAASVGKTCASAGGIDQYNCNDTDAVFMAADMELQAGAGYFDDIVVWDVVDAHAQSINRPCTLATTGEANWMTGCTNNTWTNMLNGASQNANNTNTATHVGTATLTCNNGALSYSAETCSRHCLASAQPWQTDCAGNVPLVNHGATSPSVANINAGFTGDATFTCNDGTLGVSSSSCTPIAGGCAAQPVTWNSGDCGGNAPVVAEGGNALVTNTNPGFGGNVTVTCTGGVLSQSGASCTSSCTAWVRKCDTNNPYEDYEATCALAGGTPETQGGSMLMNCESGTEASFNVRCCGATPVCNPAMDQCCSGGCVSPVNGACGTANGVPTPTAPTTGLCSAGTESSVTDNGTTWDWTCNGSGGGSNASCSAPKDCAPNCPAGTPTGRFAHGSCLGGYPPPSCMLHSGNPDTRCNAAAPAFNHPSLTCSSGSAYAHFISGIYTGCDSNGSHIVTDCSESYECRCL